MTILAAGASPTHDGDILERSDPKKDKNTDNTETPPNEDDTQPPKRKESLAETIRRLVRETNENNKQMEDIQEKIKEANLEKKAVEISILLQSDLKKTIERIEESKQSSETGAIDQDYLSTNFGYKITPEKFEFLDSLVPTPESREVLELLKRQKENPQMLRIISDSSNNIKNPSDARFISGLPDALLSDAHKLLNNNSINSKTDSTNDTNYATAIFGLGCFWCAESFFESPETNKCILPGIKNITTGYAGGITKHPTYDQVSSGLTNHAEVIRIEFDDKICKYEELLRLFFLAHDSTRSFAQKNDIGTQYRSLIVCENTAQRIAAQKARDAFEKAVRKWRAFDGSGATATDKNDINSSQCVVRTEIIAGDNLRDTVFRFLQ